MLDPCFPLPAPPVPPPYSLLVQCNQERLEHLAWYTTSQKGTSDAQNTFDNSRLVNSRLVRSHIAAILRCEDAASPTRTLEKARMSHVPDLPIDPAGNLAHHHAPDAAGMAEGEAHAEQVWASPGVSMPKRVLTALGVALAAALFIFIAAHEGASMWASTLIGAIFIGCFVWYLRIVAPTPFTLRLDAQAITREERGSAPAAIPWTGIARAKEEVFKSGTSVSLTIYKRVGERGVHRAFVVYRDDIAHFDAFLAAVRARLPEGTPYQRETVHE